MVSTAEKYFEYVTPTAGEGTSTKLLATLLTIFVVALGSQLVLRNFTSEVSLQIHAVKFDNRVH